MLLRTSWLPLGVSLLAIGLIAGLGALLALGVFVLAAGALARLWADRSLDRVTLERLLPESRAFPGDRLRLTYRLTNPKAIPLPQLEVRDQLPEVLAPADLALPPSASPGGSFYTRATYVGSRQRTSWALDLQCPERGYYRIGPARLRSGDGFGLFISEREESDTAGVVVYPHTVPLPDLGLVAARPLGDRKGREPIFEDPLRFAGLRDYQPGDPIRRIDWKATARRGELQSRVYEPSTTQHLIVALNVDTLEHPWQGYIPQLLEAGIVVAASIARWAYESRYAVGLLANASLSGSDRPIGIPAGRSPDHLPRILEALGGIGPMTVTPLADLLDGESHGLPLGATLAVVTSLMPEALAAVLCRLRGAARPLAVVSLADADWTELLGDIPVHRVSRWALASEQESAVGGPS